MSLTAEMLKEHVGVDSERIIGPDNVCRQMIRHWCEVMEDNNPLYQDEEFAAKTKYGSIIAPPTQVQVYTMTPLWPKVERAATPQELIVKLLADHGYTSIVATGQEQEYFTPMKPGDQISYTISVKEVSPQKKTARGPGFFVTFLYAYVNQRDEKVCDQTFTILAYNASSNDGGDQE